jgi:Tol biopolymer transport system component
MAMTPGTRLGPYEIVSAIGAGGMGEVYRARDRKLNRDVALKVLPEALAADPDRLARFQREAQVLASLNHPHIAHIHGFEDADDEHAIVMELVEGPTLADRIASGPLPLTETLAIARQIAEALEAAHEQGIVHRDLKPANVKVRDDGTVKVLDFGLAKALTPDAAGGAPDSANSPTLTAHATQMGMILGTAAYMAPEQARGKAVDRRADVWAFGVVLYEMLTGRRLFARDEVPDTLAAVLTVEPDLAGLPPSAPPVIHRLLARCLAKDRRQRLDSMAAARLDLDEAEEPQKSEFAGHPDAPRLSLVGVSALVAAGAALGVIAMAFWPRGAAGPAAPATSLVAQIPAPPDTLLAFYDGFELSPDGSMLAFAARTTSGLRQIWLRSLDTGAARPIPGTDSGAYPFWSPDGRSVAFFADYKLKRVNVDGGRLQTICDVPAVTFITGSWGAGGDILWATDYGTAGPARNQIFRVPAGGGTPVALDALESGARPFWLSDGRRFIYSGGTAEDWGLMLANVDGTASSVLLALVGPDRIRYAFGGGWVFINRNEALTAQRLDETSGTLVGSPVTIALDAGNPKGWFAVSSDGRRVVALVRDSPGSEYNPGAPVGRLTWVDRQGSAVGTLGDAAAYWTLRLAPDGLSAVVNLSSDLWMIRQDGRRVRLTDTNQNVGAVWSPSGEELIFSGRSQGVSGLLRRGLAPGVPAVALEGVKGSANDWSPNGRWLLTTDGDIHAYDLANGVSTPWLETRAEERQARFSPDGRWVAYASNANGRLEVYVRAFEGAGQSIPVSTTGGDYPIWRDDGRELFFLSSGNDLMSVEVTVSGTGISLGQPQKLFSLPLNDATREFFSPYDVAPGGKRFLMNLPDRPGALFFLQGLDAIMAGR